MKRQLDHRSFMEKIVLFILSATLVVSVAINISGFRSENSFSHGAEYDEETVSEASNPANEMRGLLICEEGFRLMLPLNKPANHTSFQEGLAHNFYKNISLVRYGAMQNHRVGKQQFSLATLLNLYIQLRI